MSRNITIRNLQKFSILFLSIFIFICNYSSIIAIIYIAQVFDVLKSDLKSTFCDVSSYVFSIAAR